MTQPAFAQIAPISRRAIGYLIDAAIAGGLAVILGGGLMVAATLAGGLEGTLSTLLVGGPIVSLLLLGWFVVYTWMQSGKGSIGMRAQGLRLVSATDGSSLGFGRALLRNVIFGLSAGIVVGYFTPLFDGSGRFQGWHDKVANALVLDARVSPAPAPTSVSAAPATTAIPAMPPMPADLGGPAIPGIPAPPSAPVHPGGFTAPTGFDAPAPAPAPAPTPAPAPVSGAFTVPETGSGAFAAPAPAPASESAPAAAPAPAMPVADEGSLIAFVPGVSQTRPPAPAIVTPAPAPLPDAPADETGFDLDPALDETLVQRPSTPSVPVTAPTPAPPFEPSAPPVPPFAAPPVPPLPAAFEPAPEPALFVPAPAAPVPSEPARGFVSDDDDDAELEETRISIPGHRLIFTWDDGTRVPVSRRTIFGRNPAAEDGAVIVPVRDETLSLSKTHFEAASEASGGWVLDRHSTNGMTIVRDGQRIACPAGQRVPVRLGDAIEIGDRIVTVGGYA